MKKNSLRIVIADDEATIRLNVRTMLTEAGHDVVAEAADGFRAVEEARTHKPDLIILDVNMPRLNGLEATRQIAKEKIAPVLMVMAFNQMETALKNKIPGVLEFIVKPIEEKNLFPAIEGAVSHWQEMQSLSQELESLKNSLETRKLLDRAKGILMEANHFTERESYRRIQRYAMMKQMSIKEVAEAILSAAKKRGGIYHDGT